MISRFLALSISLGYNDGKLSGSKSPLSRAETSLNLHKVLFIGLVQIPLGGRLSNP